jgi:hypothetical protein
VVPDRDRFDSAGSRKTPLPSGQIATRAAAVFTRARPAMEVQGDE